MLERSESLSLARHIITAIRYSISPATQSSAPVREWPSHNLILNRDSFDNFDSGNGEGADKFAFNLTSGSGSVFRGCIAHNNIDDGWDVFTWDYTGAIGAVTIENNLSYSNDFFSNGGSTTDSDRRT